MPIAPGNNDRFAATGMKSVTDNRFTRLIMGIMFTIDTQLSIEYHHPEIA
jgi:hypothetical protein